MATGDEAVTLSQVKIAFEQLKTELPESGGKQYGSFTLIDDMGGLGPSGTYQFEIGMTWGDFIESKYNVDGLIDYYGSVGYDNGYDPVLQPNGDYPYAKLTWPIMNNSKYYWSI